MAAGGRAREVLLRDHALRVSVGWPIYPPGYFLGYLCGSVSVEAPNVVYNIADVINKIAFCLAIWSSAKKDTAEKRLLA